MKASLNKVELIGNIGQQPELKTTANGNQLVNIQIATTRGKKDQAGNWKDETTWHKVTLWNRLAEVAKQYSNKGDQVYIEGFLQNNEWTDADGNKRYGTSIVAEKFLMLGGKKQPQGYRPPKRAADPVAVVGEPEPDMPF